MFRTVSRQLLRWSSNEKPIALRTTQAVGQRMYSIYEPDYLSALGPQQPVYDLLDIQMKAYNFPALSRYQGYVHRIANSMGLIVEDSWATPSQVFQVNKFKPRTTIIDQTYKIHLYERNVQIKDFPCTLTPIFFEIIQTSLPEGVQLSIHSHGPEHDEIRYIPDLDLIELKTQLQVMATPTQHKKK